MIFLYLLACVMHTYNAEARVTSIVAGGSEGGFYVTSDLYCGPLFWPRAHKDQWSPVDSEITHCDQHEGKKGKPIVECDNLADTRSLGWSITELDSFKIRGSSVLCNYWLLIGPNTDESGWTPT